MQTHIVADLDIERMQQRLHTALNDQRVYEFVYDDFMHTMIQLGLTKAHRNMVGLILSNLAMATDLLDIERQIHSDFENILIGRLTLSDVLEEKMKDRARIIYGQVWKFFDSKQQIIDWGCGDGMVTDQIYHHITHNIEGFDVRNYRARGIVVPTNQFDGAHVPVMDGHYTAGLMTNVAHHEAENAKILTELARIIRPGGTLVVIETVPVSDDRIQFERTFVADYIYNRLFRDADIPVPGTYETESGWVKRFQEVGFELSPPRKVGIPNPTPLGYDQSTIRDWHTRLILTRS
jgi:ubiquinone/menaquinone biosynthesis C-methylase UbiE